MPPITSASTPSSAIAAERAEYVLIKDLDREKRNERKNVQPNVFHSSYLLNFLVVRGRFPAPSLTIA